MAVAKLSAQDCKDLQKYLRYFVYKSVQVIVQSRLGDRVNLPSKQFATGVDWFNLTVRDDPDVLAEVKRVYPGAGGGLTGGDVVCVETSLRMSNGGVVPLEIWVIKLVSPCDAAVRVSFTVYNRIGILLKSLLIASRSVPAYQLSRRCCSKTCDYSIYYRICIGEPTLDQGHSFCSRTVGVVPTPIGTIHLSVAYRTQVSLESGFATVKNLELRDDHFCADRSTAVSGVPAQGWHAVSKWQNVASPDPHDHELLSTSPPDHDRMVSIPFDLNQIADDVRGAGPENKTRTAAFGSPGKSTQPCFDFDTDAVIPFRQLLEHNVCENPEKKSAENTAVRDAKTASGTGSMTSSETDTVEHSRQSTARDIGLHTLKTPFASCVGAPGGDEREGDLGRFYRECQSAPSLSMFQQPTSDVHYLLNSITDQLAQFEANAKEFDEFVNSFQEN